MRVRDAHLRAILAQRGKCNGSRSSLTAVYLRPSTRNESGTNMLSTNVTKQQSRAQDDSLTNLNWLHSLNIMGGVATPPTPPASPLPPPPPPPTEGRRRSRPPPPPDDVDYRVNGDAKPPYSYATLICMAMKANKNKMTLSSIYKWIRENFLYYRRAEPSWQNSIRHNLSLNKCFVKVPRSKDEPGKGGFWRLDPAYADALVDGVFKKRRVANGSSHKRQRRPAAGTAPPASVPLQLPPLQALVSPPTSRGANDTLDLKGDFSWNALLSEDEMDAAYRQLTTEEDEPLFTDPPGPDLTIHGTHIPTPEWWRLTGEHVALASSLLSTSAPDGDLNGWSDVDGKHALDSPLDLEGLIDLDGVVHVY